MDATETPQALASDLAAVARELGVIGVRRNKFGVVVDIVRFIEQARTPATPATPTPPTIPQTPITPDTPGAGES